MTENISGSPHGTTEQLPPTEGTVAEVLPGGPETPALGAEEVRAAFEGWLDRRGLLKDTPRLTMARGEFEVLSNVGQDDTSFLVDKAKESYGIPADEQYVGVDVVPDDATQPHATKVVTVGEEDFGTVIDEGRLPDLRPEDMPHITMNEREFNLFGVLGATAPSRIEYARDLYGISKDPQDPQNDQYAPQYALLDIASDDPNLPNESQVMVVTKADFGTTIDFERIAKDFQEPDPNPDPDSPQAPPESSPTYVKVDIGEALADSYGDLQAFATTLMEGNTTDPFSRDYGDVAVRAGGLAHGQKDAYVWTYAPIAESIKLTLLGDSKYDSVCVVRGQMREAGNGKAGMAQIDNPEVVLRIDGDNLARLQRIYHSLYGQPDFALTDSQRQQRDALFNDYVVGFISEATRTNQSRQDDEARTSQQPKVRYHQRPS